MDSSTLVLRIRCLAMTLREIAGRVTASSSSMCSLTLISRRGAAVPRHARRPSTAGPGTGLRHLGRRVVRRVHGCGTRSKARCRTRRAPARPPSARSRLRAARCRPRCRAIGSRTTPSSMTSLTSATCSGEIALVINRHRGSGKVPCGGRRGRCRVSRNSATRSLQFACEPSDA